MPINNQKGRNYLSKTYLIDDDDIATSTQLDATNAVVATKASQVDVDSRVLKTTTVNGHALSSNVTVTQSDVGLGNVDNTSDANKPISTATQTALNLKANLASPTFTGTVGGITSTMVGLGNVNNTSDANKPISTATQTALDLKANLVSPAFTGTPTINGSPIPLGGAILSCPVNNTVLATSTGTVYTSPGNSATPLTVTGEGAVSFACPRAGTLRNLFVRSGTIAVTNTPTTVIVIRKNGADTAITLNLTQTVNTTSSDTTHSASVAQGDLITVSLVTTGTLAVSVSIASIAFELG